MKEVMAVIRMDMISKTKEALLKEGFSALSCSKVMGRGKKKVDFMLIESILSGQEINQIASPTIAEAISEGHRLIPKRLLSIVVKDREVNNLLDVLIAVNQKGSPGDGKIFVMPVFDAVRIRTGESGELAL